MRPLNLSSSQLHDLLSSGDVGDVALLKYANAQREALWESPAQSEFRVYALLVVEIDVETDSGSYRELTCVEGANAEPDYLGGSICAERAAITKLRMMSDPVIRKIIVVSVVTFALVLCLE